MSTPSNVTQLLVDFQEGNKTAADRLWAEVYDELRRIAHHRLRRERANHTLSTTALVHEAYLKLINQSEVEWEDRLHFFAMSSRIMRNILVDYARRRTALKRGGNSPHLRLDDAIISADMSAEVFLALDEALKQLTELDERLGRVVEYRFFGGLQEKEIATLLGVSKRTVRRDWRKARAWLGRALADDNPAPASDE